MSQAGRWEGVPADGEPETHGGQAAHPSDEMDVSPSSPTDRSVTASFGSTFSSSEEKVEYAAEILRLPLHERPICPYEQTEYNMAVTDAMQPVSP